MKRLAIGALCTFSLTFAIARTFENDTIKTQEPNEVVVEAYNQKLWAKVSTSMPILIILHEYVDYVDNTIARILAKLRRYISLGEIRKSSTPQSIKLRLKSLPEKESICKRICQSS